MAHLPENKVDHEIRDIIEEKRRISKFFDIAHLFKKNNDTRVWDIFEKARTGDKDQLHSYLRNHNINSKTKDGKTALYLAAEHGRLTELTTLIEADADVNISTSHDHINTPIMAASKNGHFKCLQALIKSGAQVNDLDKDRQSALMLAIGKLNCFKALIEAGACVNQRTSSGVAVLDLVSSREEMQALIKAGADVTDRTLMFATNVKCIQLLLSKGVSPNKQDHLGSTALMYLCKFYTHLNMKDTDLKAMQALFEAGVDVNITDHSGCTALMMAAEAGNPITVKTLLQAKADPDIQDREGKTALMYAWDKDCIKILVCLGGANPNKRDNYGNTTLIYACRTDTLFQYGRNNECLTAIQALLEAGADVNLTDSSRRTALMIAAKHNNVRIVQKLLQAKADPNKQDRCGKTALMYAKDKDCVQALISYGANMELEDNSQRTALILALKEYRNYKQRFELLLDSGANPVINVSHRSWLHKLFLSEHYIDICEDYTRFAMWKLLENDNKGFLRFLTGNGIVIDYSKFYGKSSRNKSAMGNALQKRQLDVVKYFMANCYLNYDALKDMRTILYDIRRQWLKTHRFNRWQLYDERSDHSFNEEEIPLEEIQDETHKLLQQALNEPWPLVKLAFIAVSSALGPSPGRIDRIAKTGLPDRLQRMLMFQEPISLLPVSEWEDIPLTFDPVEYEKLPKPKPLLYYWPVGSDLVI